MMDGKKKVYVGLSGGVDSAVSAALLREAGYDVTGVFINVWQPDFIECSVAADRLEAMRVAAHLDIPFRTLDLEKEYKQEVVDYMLSEYRAGRTPNPDVMCNRHIKFGAFFDWAITEGADYVATGHYTRIADYRGLDANKRGGKVLLKGVDDNKDQSYFLWTLTPEKLSRVLFPVGDIEKPEVRKLAKKFNLPNAERKDSQGLCMVGNLDMKEFLKHYLEEKAGTVLNEKGEVIGTHEGAWFFTIGERHGFTITAKTPNDAPLYVVSKNIENNTITAAERFQATETVNTKEISMASCNWLVQPEAGKVYSARTRYRQKLLPCTIVTNGSEAKVIFTTSTEPIAPGQSLVLYDDEICMGGGIIANDRTPIF